MRFRGIRLVKQNEENFRLIHVCLEEKQNKTRRERLKSALYRRLKKRKVFKIVKRGTLSTF